MKGAEQDIGNDRSMRKVVVTVAGISAAAAVVAFKDHPDSLAITIGAIFAFLLVFRLADPAGHRE